jgi:hypothetical protein
MAVMAALKDKSISFEDLEQYRIKDFRKSPRWKR